MFIAATDVTVGQRVMFKGEFREVVGAWISRHDGPVLTLKCPWRPGMPDSTERTQWWPSITLGTNALVEIA